MKSIFSWIWFAFSQNKQHLNTNFVHVERRIHKSINSNDLFSIKRQHELSLSLQLDISSTAAFFKLIIIINKVFKSNAFWWHSIQIKPNSKSNHCIILFFVNNWIEIQLCATTKKELLQISIYTFFNFGNLFINNPNFFVKFASFIQLMIFEVANMSIVDYRIITKKTLKMRFNQLNHSSSITNGR